MVKAVGREKFIDAMKADEDAQLLLENEIRKHHELPQVKVLTRLESTSASTEPIVEKALSKKPATRATTPKKATVKKAAPKTTK